jgi:hypothetical protein
MLVTIIALHALAKLVLGQELHELSEDRLSGKHQLVLSKLGPMESGRSVSEEPYRKKPERELT